MLQILTLTLGPVQTNTYLLADSATGETAVIDPAWDGETILAEANRRGWKITQIWITHAHFDHMAGTAAIARGLTAPPLVALHPADKRLWQMKGGAPLFGMQIESGPDPSIDFRHGQILQLGSFQFEVRHAPGHTPGHVLLYCADAKLAFVGDIIFAGSIGRTDLPGGDYDTLIASIRTQVLTLPEETRLLSGHGEETIVKRERLSNPFLV